MEKFIIFAENHGIALVFVGIVLFFGVQVGQLYIKRLRLRNEGNDVNLIDHVFFSFIVTAISGVDRIQLSTAKKEVFRKILKVLFYTFKDRFAQYIQEGNYQNQNTAQLKASVLRLVHDATEEFQSRLQKEHVPELFINKFLDWHFEAFNNIILCLENVFDSHFYPSNKQRLAAALDVLTLGFKYTQQQARITLDALNGELENYLLNSTPPNEK